MALAADLHLDLTVQVGWISDPEGFASFFVFAVIVHMVASCPDEETCPRLGVRLTRQSEGAGLDCDDEGFRCRAERVREEVDCPQRKLGASLEAFQASVGVVVPAAKSTASPCRVMK